MLRVILLSTLVVVIIVGLTAAIWYAWCKFTGRLDKVEEFYTDYELMSEALSFIDTIDEEDRTMPFLSNEQRAELDEFQRKAHDFTRTTYTQKGNQAA